MILPMNTTMAMSYTLVTIEHNTRLHDGYSLLHGHTEYLKHITYPQCKLDGAAIFICFSLPSSTEDTE
jgi:hypothetical protein